MASIDGIGGPKGPGGSKPVEPVGETERTQGAQRPFSVDAPDATQAAPEAQPTGDVAVTEAVEHVAADLRAGRLHDLAAAFDAVVTRIVEARYPDMAVRQRRTMAKHLQEILADDPGLGARITAELERAAAE